MEVYSELEEAIKRSDSAKVYRSLRKAIKYSQAHPEISIPNQGLYLWGNTELTHRLMELDGLIMVCVKDVEYALDALIRPPLTPDEALGALISLQL
jgi:hypothetical protein